MRLGNLPVLWVYIFASLSASGPLASRRLTSSLSETAPVPRKSTWPCNDLQSGQFSTND
jgi:hypothetical protein